VVITFRLSTEDSGENELNWCMDAQHTIGIPECIKSISDIPGRRESLYDLFELDCLVEGKI